jgi:hypothetical protein
MRNILARIRLGAALVLAVAFIAGCTSAVSSGHNTLLDADDLDAMTNQMTASMVGDPTVQATIAAQGPLKVVCEPVENQMTGVILPTGQAQLYTASIRSALSQHAPDKFTWIMNRNEFYALRGKELEQSLGPSPDAINPQYALVGQFNTLTQEDENHRSDYYLCTYRLTSLDHRTILWEHAYKVKKSAIKGFLD